MQPQTYLDYNATAPLKPEAKEAALAAMDVCGNPSSVHWAGRAVRRIVEDARAAVAAYLNASAEGVVFTSGATEANNIALRGFAAAEEKSRILVGATEHDSILDAVGDVEKIPVKGDGTLDLDALQQMLDRQDGEKTLVSVMVANNETGVLHPVEEIVAIAKGAGALVHCDAVQAVGAIPLDIAALGVDFLSFSGHKLGALRGVGALVINGDHHISAHTTGGGQEKGRRSGTENVAGIASIGAVLAGLADRQAHTTLVRDMRDWVEHELTARFPGIIIAGGNAPRHGHTANIILPSVASDTQVMSLDLDGIAVSAGSACSSGKIKGSHVLDAMGFAPDLAGSGLRVSFGWASTQDDAARFVDAYDKMARRLQRTP